MKGIERVKGRVKSPKPRTKAKTNVDYTKLSLAIMSQYYQLVYIYYVAQKLMKYIIGIMAYPKIVDILTLYQNHQIHQDCKNKEKNIILITFKIGNFSA